MSNDTPLSTVLQILNLIVGVIAVCGPYLSQKSERWKIQKALNLIFGFALIGTNLLMIWYSAPAEVQIYSAAGAVWLPYTNPSSIQNLPHQFVPIFGNFVSIFTTFLILAGIGLMIGFNRLHKASNIHAPPTKPHAGVA
jgi:hypothetical protein